MPDAKTILVVDDDEALCTALDSKFRAKGYTVSIAHDGNEGMEQLKNQQFDVVITDLHMPNADGFDLLKKIGKTKNSKTPVYVITNLGSESFCTQAKDLGAKECFVKSMITLKDVVKLVDQAA